MKNLLEKEYEDIFSPKTMAALKSKSGESFSQLDVNQSVKDNITSLLPKIIDAEKDYRDELEMLAVQIVTDLYPIVDKANIKIDAKIENNVQLPPPSEDEIPVEDLPDSMMAKRRVINGITQGASVRGAFSYTLFKDYLDQINPELVKDYTDLLKNIFYGIYDDPKVIAMLLAAVLQQSSKSSGSSEMIYDEDTNQFVIKARAICFPILVHEIVKGLYEIVGTQGFGMDAEKNKAIISAVDKLSNEPNDLRFGKFLYDAISDLYNKSNINDARVRELFFAKVYELDDSEFLSFVENAINNELTSKQKQWATTTMRDIETDLKKDDTGLDEIFIGMKHSELKEMIRRVVKERKLTNAEKKKKEQIVKGMKKSFKGDKEAMYAIATAKAKKVAEAKVMPASTPSKMKDKTKEIAEGSDHEVAMAQNSLKSIAKATIELNRKLGNQERNIPGWIQDHIAKAENYIEQAAQGFHELAEEKDPLDVVVAEKKGKDLTGPEGKPDGKIDSADYLKARDIAIKAAMTKKK